MTQRQQLGDKVTASPTVSQWTGPAENWDRFVMDSTDSSMSHLFAWKAVMEGAYGHKTFYLAAHDESGIRAVLPLVLTRSPIFGTHLVSMPYLDVGGIVASDDEAGLALFNRARELHIEHNATLDLRQGRDSNLDLSVSMDRVTMLLELSEKEEEQWSRLRSNLRRKVRRGQSNGLQASFHGEEALDEFFGVFATNMRDLGSPVHGIAFFRSILRNLEKHAKIVLVRDGERTVGAGLCLFMGDVISLPWVSSLRKYFSQYPNQVLYWEVLRFAIANGFGTLDFGRSRVGDGTYEAKRRWGAEPTQLFWYSDEDKARPTTEKTKKLSWAMSPWKHLPLPVANTVGPWLRKGIPN